MHASADSTSFTRCWKNTYSDVQPIGWALRQAFPNRWLRIHSLPECKRYAESEHEWNILKSRHQHAASLLFQEKEQGVLIAPEFCIEHEVLQTLELTCAISLPKFQPDDDEPATGYYCRVPFCWSFPTFTPILEAIADDAIRAIFTSADSTRIYAPYDGGADLFCTDSVALHALRLALGSYLSPLPSGL